MNKRIKKKRKRQSRIAGMSKYIQTLHANQVFLNTVITDQWTEIESLRSDVKALQDKRDQVKYLGNKCLYMLEQIDEFEHAPLLNRLRAAVGGKLKGGATNT